MKNQIKKYYQIFISSPTNEYEKIRKTITLELMQQDRYFPVAMEFMTSYENTFQMLLNYMKYSDACIVLIKDKLGSQIGESEKYLTSEMKSYLTKYMNNVGIKEYSDLTYTEFEYATAQYLNVKVFAFVDDESILKLSDEAKAKRLYDVVRSERMYGKISTTEIIATLNKYFDESDDAKGWIRETDSKIVQSTLKAGIHDIYLDGVINNEMFKELTNQANHLKMLFTTGKSIIVSKASLLVDFLAKGGSIQLMCMKPHSQSLIDVQKIEELNDVSNRASIHDEYSIVVSELLEIVDRAKSKSKQIGNVEIAFCDTLMRSSFLLFENEKNNFYKGWFTITLPPAKSRESLSFFMEASSLKNDKSNLYDTSYTHFKLMWEYAEKNQNIIRIDKEKVLNSHVDEYWEIKQKEAIKNMRKLKRKTKVLIEVAAQHPLVDGFYPNEEFQKRLDHAIQLCKSLEQKNIAYEIYVPGSVHLDFDGVEDEIALSSAGKNYLIEQGMAEHLIHGEDLNQKYDDQRNHKGVYNSADECYVASKYFFEQQSFSQLYCICSPNQLVRKMLFYLENGIYPQMISVPSDKMFHDFLKELTQAVPYVYLEDHSYQEKDSKEAIRTRKERFPNYE